jgi:hypothetical protein
VSVEVRQPVRMSGLRKERERQSKSVRLKYSGKSGSRTGGHGVWGDGVESSVRGPIYAICNEGSLGYVSLTVGKKAGGGGGQRGNGGWNDGVESTVRGMIFAIWRYAS